VWRRKRSYNIFFFFVDQITDPILDKADKCKKIKRVIGGRDKRTEWGS
jgi:hypothetical protein